jgi:Coenzyme PQQ synthesis protein D (PqqD).
MKTKTGFRLRNVCGENVIVAEGIENIDFSKIISMNESAAYLWQKVEGKSFTIDDLTRLLCEAYEVDEETAKADSQTVLQQWLDAGIAEE